MPITIDRRNQQHLVRGHATMCHCKMLTHSLDISLLSELAKIADEARGYCLDAPEVLPSGGGSELSEGQHGWFQPLRVRNR